MTMGPAATVRSHVAGGLPIRQAARVEPTEPADSGWQFLCNSGADEDLHLAQVWSIEEVLETEPTLRPWVDSQPGTILLRPDTESPRRVWQP